MPGYHMRRSDRELTDAAEIEAILREGRYATIAFARADEPYLVTLSYGYDASTSALYFHVAPAGCKLDFMRDNPRVCATIIADKGYMHGECAHSYASLVFRGELTLVEDHQERVRGMRALIAHLETEPDPIAERNAIDAIQTYERVAILRLSIEDISGKQGT